MRFVLKTLIKGVMAFMTIAVMWFTLSPATAVERGALGPDHSRMQLVQLRLARTMLQVAPEQTVAMYAEATGLPEQFILARLTEVANGRKIGEASEHTEPYGSTVVSNRRIEAGGALFVTPD